MSSTYRVLCLSHDPALVAVDRDWQSGAGGLDQAVAAARKREDLDGHERCDLAVGRYSYPLIEVACVGGCPENHSTSPRWIDRDVLMLLWHAHHSGHQGLAQAATAGSFRCWPRTRLRLLRDELALPDLGQPGAAAVAADAELAQREATLDELDQADKARRAHARGDCPNCGDPLHSDRLGCARCGVVTFGKTGARDASTS